MMTEMDYINGVVPKITMPDFIAYADHMSLNQSFTISGLSARPKKIYVGYARIDGNVGVLIADIEHETCKMQKVVESSGSTGLFRELVDVVYSDYISAATDTSITFTNAMAGTVGNTISVEIFGWYD